MVGKYGKNKDAYHSVVKALEHAAVAVDRNLKIDWIEASNLEDANHESWEMLKKSHGVVVPGGFGERGLEGKIKAINYVRTQNVPFLGICLGMQASVIEYARNVCSLPDSNSQEFSSKEGDAIIFMPEGDKEKMGGTMRLGSRITVLTEGSVAHKTYGSLEVLERHRHRYEVNPEIVSVLAEQGMVFSGVNQDETGKRMEVLELPNNKYFVATQYHPEFKSRPTKPSPVFLGLLTAAS
jgi:CTP synthase